MSDSSRSTLQTIGGLVLAVLLCEGVGIIASVATQSSVQTWYPTLIKPFFTPPNGLFAPVWIVLYAMMGIAAWMVWATDASSSERRRALGLFALQLILNGLWSIAFFGLRSPGSGFVTIVLLWVAIAATLRDFFGLRRAAGWLMVPYLLWVTYAAALNAAIWGLN